MGDVISEFTTSLAKHPDGYWVTKGASADVSYPDDGHDIYFTVEDDSFWFRHRNKVVAAVIGRFEPPGVLFDVGGGNGHAAAALQAAGREVVLVEPMAEGARNARARGVENVICATLAEAGLADGSLPAVGLFDVLEHLEDDAGLLSRVREKMRDDGRLYVAVPSYPGLWSAEDAFIGHYRRYTARSLNAVLESSGFEVEYRSYFFWALPVPILVSRTIPTALGLRGSPSQGTTARDHAVGGGVAARAAERMLAAELPAIRAGRSVPFGGSCLAVARPKGASRR
ncbi:MAG: class I SAM-dependent methyltransferase [Coriobacteriia bacterium]|nr:class I SAM-dependent methyltransferase [Coriobacteriia bacterium]